ncbi:FhaB protein [Bibersteinia trehalosi USDA-ARS-USMARC-188]|uniref:FhaB protein n=1 Tax=Bibersteinia trehalosi USDA-ARS-USMARC-188 TaxID=1263829 RepID=A0A4V7IAT3_BIBTR|nr:FhaB protein [Bibersteinia trehalosi USDA-ARS-USMARC-188]
MVGEWLLNGRDPAFLPPKEKEDLTNKSKLIVGSVSAVTGGDVDSAAQRKRR